jgi:hypothetical protein
MGYGGYGIWDMGYGIWDMGYGIWDMGYGIWDMVWTQTAEGQAEHSQYLQLGDLPAASSMRAGASSTRTKTACS